MGDSSVGKVGPNRAIQLAMVATVSVEGLDRCELAAHAREDQCLLLACCNLASECADFEWMKCDKKVAECRAEGPTSGLV